MKQLSQQVIKQNNLKQLYSLVAANNGISRSALASITGLSKTTVSALVEILIHEGFLQDCGASTTGRQGRHPNSLCLDGERNAVIVVNWLPAKLQLGCVKLTGDITDFREVSFDSAQDYTLQISQAYRSLAAGLSNRTRPPKILALCIIVPSIINSNQKSLSSSVLPIQAGEWSIRRLRAAIPDVPMAVFNDTACFAYAEAALFLDHSPMIFVNLSGGVGAVMLSGGRMLRGANGDTTQFGHFSVLRDGPLCRCGNRGCLERRIGESVLKDRAREFMTAGQIEAFGRMDYETLGAAAGAGRPECRRMADSMAADLAFALGNFLTLYHAERCILGGAGRRLGDYFLQRLQSHLEGCGFREFVRDCAVQYSRAPEYSSFTGAARYFIDTHYRFEEGVSGSLFLM